MKLHLKLNNENNIYYNCSKCYSYNYFMNIIIGGRGIGKTTTFLIKALTNYKNKNEEFIYVRRYKPELKKFVSKDTLGTVCDGIRYSGDGAGGYIFKIEDKTIGYGISLSTSRSYKSVSFDKVSTIIFDEAILHSNNTTRYLNDEVVTFLEFVSTVFRTRTNTKVIILGNNEDLFNPYFSYFNIPIFDNIYTDSKRGIYCELPKNSPALIEKEKKTPLYSLIKDTAYGDYHYDNKLLSRVKIETMEKPKDTKLLFRIVYNNDTINVFNFLDDNKEIKLYCERKNKRIEDNYSYIILDNGKLNYYYVDRYKHKIKNFLERFYFNKRIYYDDEKTGEYITWLTDKI